LAKIEKIWLKLNGKFDFLKKMAKPQSFSHPNFESFFSAALKKIILTQKIKPKNFSTQRKNSP
jgi:hypothetical protein